MRMLLGLTGLAVAGLVAAAFTSLAAMRAAAGEGGLLPVGSQAPDVGGVDQKGVALRLSDLRGKKVVLYFYPKDDTPGCTVEAKGFRDKHGDLGGLDAVVVGVSTDGAESHREFADKHRLPFRLLADPDGDVARAFGVPVTFGFAKRVTFLLDRQGVVARVFADVTPAEHAGEVLAAVKALP